MVQLSHSFIAITAFLAHNAVAQKCTGQSCAIANLSGSTGLPFKVDAGKGNGGKPTGGSDTGYKCIAKYYEYGAGIPPQCANPKVPCVPKPKGAEPKPAAEEAETKKRWLEVMNAGFHWPSMVDTGRLVSRIERMKRTEQDRLIGQAMARPILLERLPVEAEQTVETVVEEVELEKRQLGGCKDYTLVFARGTTEPGTMGMTVGPALQAGLSGSKWDIQGVSYSASIDGINCIGLPGGVKAMAQINKISEKCPNTKIVAAGYSQGAMVRPSFAESISKVSFAD